ncbi:MULTISPECIES: DUF427 domain-containing protein [Aurantimonas]|uniref:DUF427 domain-containing protein n=1 Tax=Aurantimonas TaxID=182269 RepID=UPI000428FF4A|nr:DUF427 domain-containing protein [Aurantimonas coralicida]
MTTDMEQRTRERIRIEPATGPVIVNFHGAILASTNEALVLHETGYDPVYYIPKDRVEMAYLRESDRRTTCPFKGEARYWSITAEAQAADDAVWAYDTPHAGVGEIAGHVAFDPSKVTVAVD